MDTAGLLNDIFGIRNVGNIENTANNLWDIGDPMSGGDDQFVDEFMCNNGMNEGENDEDVGYRRLVEQAKQELYPGSSFSNYLSFCTYFI